MSALKLLGCTTILFVLAFVSLEADQNRLLTILPLLYLTAFVLAAFAIYDEADMVHAYFRPSSIMILYVALFFFLGSFAFKNELILPEAGRQFEFYMLDDLGTITCYFLSAIGVSLAAQLLARRRASAPADEHDPEDVEISWSARRVFGGARLLSVIVVVITPLIEIPLPGGSGSFSSTFFMFAAVHLVYVAKLRGRRHRFGVYGILALVLAVFFYSDRRLLFYFGFIVAFIELYDRIPFRIRPRNAIVFVTLGICFIAANIAMSVHRGVGSYGSESIIDAFTYVDDYLAADWARTMLLHNFEGPPATFHSYNAVHYMLNSADYRYGTTLVKVLYLPLPRDRFPNKPRSMVDEYTAIHYPEYRARGGSYVPNFYAEAFWNFGMIGGLVFLFCFFYCADTIYCRWLVRLRREISMHNVFFLSSFAFLLFLFRGSGFDLYGLFVILFYLLIRAYRLFSIRVRIPAQRPGPAVVHHQNDS